MPFLDRSFFVRIFLTLIPFTVLVAVLYTLLISFSLNFVEDHVLHGYLERELAEIRNEISKNRNSITLPKTSYLSTYWENDPKLNENFKNLEIGTHESSDSKYHILVGEIPEIERKIYIVLDENEISSFEQYKNIIDIALWIVAVLVIISGIIIVYFIAKMIANPVKQLAFDVQNNLYPEKLFHGAERKDEIGKLSRSFSDLVNRLQRSLDIEKSFTQHASHEMKTPLSIIRNSISVLKIANCDEEKKTRNITRIQQACVDSERILDVFLTLGKESISLSKDEIYIRPLVEKIVANYIELINTKNYSIEIIADQFLTIYAEPSLTEVLLNNLIKNALYYGKDSLKIIITNESISIDNIIDTAPTEVNKFGYGLEIVRRICEIIDWGFYTHIDESNFKVKIDFIKVEI